MVQRRRSLTLLDSVFSADEDSSLTLLSCSNNDATLAGDQWALELLFNGVSMHEHVFTEGNPNIENIGIGGLGSTA